MGLFVSALWGALISIAGTLVGQVLLSLGIGYVTYTGVDASLLWAKAQFLGGMGSLPAAALGIAGALKIGVCVSMILSAVTARLTLAGLSAAGTVKRMVVK